MLFIKCLERFRDNFDQLLSPYDWILLRSGMLLVNLKRLNVFLAEKSSGLWSIDAQKNVLEAPVIDVFINCEKDVVDDLFLWDDGVVKVVDDVHDKQMRHLVSYHFFKWFLDWFDYQFPVFGIEDVEKSACDCEALLWGKQRWQFLLHGLR